MQIRFPSMEEIIRRWTLPCWSKEEVDEFDRLASQAFLEHLKIKGNNGRWLFLTVLDGACDFCASFRPPTEEELIRRGIEYYFDQVKINSYGKDVQGGKPTMRQDTSHEVCGWHVVLVEDIVDRCLGMDFAINHYLALGASDVTVVTRLDKIVNRDPKVKEHNIIYGHRINDLKEKEYFYLGRGLDFLEQDEYRKLPEIRKIHRARAGWLVWLKDMHERAKSPSGQ